MRLQSKILILLIPLIVVPLATVGYIAYQQQQNNIKQNRFNELHLIKNQVDVNFTAHVNTAMANVELFSSSFLVEKYALTTNEEERFTLLQRPLLNLFSSYQQAYPSYYEIRFILPDGYESARRSTGNVDNLTEEEANDEFIQSLYKDRKIQTSVRVNPDNNELALYVGKALYLIDASTDPLRAPGVLRGSLVVTDNLKVLETQIKELKFGSSGKLFLLDGEGQFYFVKDEQDFMEAIAENLPMALEAPLQLEMGDDAFYVSAQALYQNLFLVAILPATELMAATRQLAVLVVVITLATIIVFVTLLLLALRRLVIQPLRKLDDASYAIAHGNMDVQVSVPGDDEIASLARSFSNMANSLSESHAQVKYMAHHDALTGLPNRHMFKEYFSRTLSYAKRHKEVLALMFLDIDEFKQVNDTLGHEAGDQLLQQISDRLSDALRGSDLICSHTDMHTDSPGEMIARIGGDEFTLLLPDIAQPENASKVAERVLQNLKPTFVINKHKFFIGGSIGITLYPDDGDTVEALTKHADLAMYEAKRSGKNTYHFYKPEMNVLAMQRVKMEARLRQAIEANDFVLHYQPLIDMQTGKVSSLEALIRWRDSESGKLIYPNDFISVAEETGLIVPIGEWVLNEACRQLREWLDKGMHTVPVSVNASSIQLGEHDLPVLIQDALQTYRLPAEKLEIELTESIVMSAADEAVENLRRIKALGVSIALDDFGTGYSSLSYLRDFEIDTLKIDRSFISEIEEKVSQRSIISAIIAMSHTLDLRVVAEGIEVPQQLAFLLDNKCDIAQGFLFSKPLSVAKVESLLESNLNSPYALRDLVENH